MQVHQAACQSAVSRAETETNGNTKVENEDSVQPETKKPRLCNAEPGSCGGSDGGDGDGGDSKSRAPNPSAATGGIGTGTHRNETLPSTRWLLIPTCDRSGLGSLAAALPPSLRSFEEKKIGRDLDKLRGLLDQHGLRTSRISSPREAVSVYKDSCLGGDDEPANSFLKDGTDFLLVTFGLHPQQEELEKYFRRSIQNTYCLLLFCKKMREEYHSLLGLSSSESASASKSQHVSEPTNAIDNEINKQIEMLIGEIEKTTSGLFRESLSSTKIGTTKEHHGGVSSRFAEEQVTALIELASAVKGKRRYRAEEWKKEYQRICVANSTISNAYLFLLQLTHEMCIQDILFKYNPKEPKYERITIYLYDPAIDYRKPGLFSFLPGLRTVLTRGPHELVSDMIESFWSQVLRNGYFPTAAIQEVLEPQLRSFFLSGLVAADARGTTYLPLPLKASFVPSAPLSIYLHGKAGAGKSSLAKVLPMALQSTLEEHIDPECMARFVKQNLNKRLETLELEFQLRPNNNDMSVMSIIQGRRMAMSQSKPGLVVLNLEELPMDSSLGNDPNQEAVAQLISQRFGGRKGKYQSQEKQRNIENKGRNGHGNNAAPRNSDKRSIGRDFSLVTIFTSNYPLAENSKTALAQLELYKSLAPIEIFSITGSDRRQFAQSYLSQCLTDLLEENCDVELSPRNMILDIASISSDGDTRPLVRQLRMFSYYVGKLLKNACVAKEGPIIVEEIKIKQSDKNCTISVQTKTEGNQNQSSQQKLTMGNLSNWYPSGEFVFDSRINRVIDKLKTIAGDKKAIELAVILEFWFSSILAPAVILSQDKKIIEHIMDAIDRMGSGVNCIRRIDTQTYKMIKSLYDPKEMPNLRDDILKFGRGAFVATELSCPTSDSQLCIREMIEDSPSMTAFSSTKSALHKSGLLFAIHVEGEVTPEVLSRVSFIL